MKRLGTGLLVAVISITCSARAETVDQGSTNGSSVPLQEVIVTALRQRQPLQQTPVAVTALTSETLAQDSAFNMKDIGDLAPNLELHSGGGSQSQSYVFIRGIGQVSDDPSLEPGVAVYVDDVYIPRTQAGLFDFNDISQIEVLRGPQGTLYGKNTIGGAIKVTSILPNASPESSLSIDYGNYGDVRLHTAINHPLVDNRLFMRVSGEIHHRNGTTENSGPGGNMNNIDTASGRIMLRYMPSDAVDLLWAADAYRDNSSMGNVRLVGIVPNAALSGVILSSVGSLAPYILRPGGNPDVGTSYDIYADKNIGFLPHTNASGSSFHATWKGEEVTLKSITAYRILDNARILDLDGSPLSVLHIGDRIEENELSQELQALGDAGHSGLHYIGGLFYFRERVAFNFRTSSPIIGVADNRNDEVGTDSYAAYLNLTWDMGKKLSATVGGRYTLERRSLSTVDSNFDTGVVDFGPAARAANFGNASPKIEVDYKWTPQIFSYASFAEGFKSGGFNDQPTSNAEFSSFKPEKAYSYEVGLKSSFLDRRAIVNLAVFHTDYRDMQESVVENVDNALVRVVSNAAKARINGAEVESTLRIAPGLTLFGTFGLTDARYLSFVDATANYTNNALPLIAKYDYRVAAQYDVPFVRDESLSLHADWSWRSRTEQDVANIPQVSQPGYGILNGRIAVRLSGSVELAVYGHNLTDKRVIDTGDGDLSGFGLAWAYFNDPRMYGVEANLNF